MQRDYTGEMVVLEDSGARTSLDRAGRALTIIGSALVGLGAILFCIAYLLPPTPPRKRRWTEESDEDFEVVGGVVAESEPFEMAVSE